LLAASIMHSEMRRAAWRGLEGRLAIAPPRTAVVPTGTGESAAVPDDSSLQAGDQDATESPCGGNIAVVRRATDPLRWQK
jgi:hypothetical protein